jgi:transcriptional regulator with XRE-family HTH domain
MTKKEIGEIIKKRRIELGMSQKQLAELTKTHVQHIPNIEAGKTNITINRLSIFLDELNLKMLITF